MNNMLNSSTPTSSQNLAKEAKEILNQVPNIPKKPNRSKCGIDNCCVFGEPNKSFNKYCLCQ